MLRLPLTLLLSATLALAACGGSDADDEESPTTASEATGSSGSCAETEEIEVPPYKHDNRQFAVADYLTIPPAGGDHTDAALEPGANYGPEAELGEAVHLLEHGAVIGWTNGLSTEDQEAVEEAFNELFTEGYYQLATVELPELEVPFALSAWGAVQTCEELDTAAIRPFVEEWYASPKSGESALACAGRARGLPPC